MKNGIEVYRIIALITGFLIFTGYWVMIVTRFGIPVTYSASYYMLNRRKRWLFSVVIWVTAFSMMIAGNNAIIFFGGGLLLFVGGAPAYKGLYLEQVVHIVGASGCIIVGMLVLWFVYKERLLCGIFLVSVVVLYSLKKKKTGFWIELLAFYTVFIGMLLNKG